MKYTLSLLFFVSAVFAHDNYVLVGPPGSGKGTFSSFMVERGYHQICPGDILRTHIKKETELGKIIKPIVERGDYISDDIMFQIIKEQVEDCLKNSRPFIVDGFPRNEAGLGFLKQLFEAHGAKQSIRFVHFNIEDEACINRINARLVCFNCYCVYNTNIKQPEQPMVCDKCKNKLEVRMGDNVQTTVKRLLITVNL